MSTGYPVPETAPAGQGLLAALFAAVRPEWRRDIIVAPEDNPIFTLGGCRVNDCGAAAHTRKGLCRAHNLRWVTAGRPDIQEWVPTQHGPTHGRKPLQQCRVPGCEFGRKQAGMCNRHLHGWHKAGEPPVEAWAADVQHDPAEFAGFPRCLIEGCDLLTTGQPQLCESHRTRWRLQMKAGHSGDLHAFLQRAAIFGKVYLDLSGLLPQMRLEIQYGLQCRADERRLQTRLEDFRPLIRFLESSGVASLTERSEEQWLNAADSAPGMKDKSGGRRFLRYCCDRLDILQHGAGWDVEYPRDVWRLSRLGYDSGYEHLRFTRIPQPWLRELTKRWIRHRLSVGMAHQTVYLSLAAVVSLGRYLDACPKPPRDVGELTRDHLEAWVAHLSATEDSATNRLSHITGIRVFFQEVHRRGWAPELDASCMLHPEDTPRLPETPPRALPEFVMRQLETPERLALYRDPNTRAVTEVMIRCGLRGKDARGLDFDCMVRDGNGHPYLRYLNHKMNRTAFAPIDEQLVETIKTQQDRVLRRYPDGCPRLFPKYNTNPDGTKPVTYTTWFNHTKEWLEAVQLVDEQGRPFRFKAHQWRHTFATRLINLDVPQHVVQKLLDHSTPEMTAHYARLRDEKLREAWLKVRKINIRGEVVELADDQPLADAAWTRAGLAQAKQTLPNGYCGMPIHSPCEHANPCLTCPLFLTTPDFLPQHQAQRTATIELISKAEAEGHHRVAEKNKQLLGNLDRIIGACQSYTANQIVVGGSPCSTERDADAS